MVASGLLYFAGTYLLSESRIGKMTLFNLSSIARSIIISKRMCEALVAKDL